MKKIVVLTSGGDGSGMNTCLSVLTHLAIKNGIDIYASKYGYQGLIEDNIFKLTIADVENISEKGGSIIKTSRSPEFMTKQGFNKALTNLKNRDVDCAVVIGGNGSFRGSERLVDAGINVVDIPGTIDNDLGYTDTTLGFDTAVNNCVDAINKIKQTMQSNDRGIVVETMGRECADISIYSAIATGTDVIVTENESFEKILTRVKHALSRGVLSPLVVVRENILDIEKLSRYLEQETKKTFRSMVVGYLQRGGEPTVADKILATQLAVKTIELICSNTFGRAVGTQNGKVIDVSIKDAITTENSQNNELLTIFNDFSR